MPNLTSILSAIESGDGKAANDLLPLVYKELRRLAALQLAQEKPGQTLDATGLVHEAYLRLIRGQSGEVEWANRRHFFAAAAEAMRRILIENARRKGRLKRGGNFRRVEALEEPAASASVDLLQLDDALTRLAVEDALAAKVVELRYFAGLGHEEVATTLAITVYRARQKWTYARAWLRDALQES
jgi:RNA polymerase sigma factor (TIGR02999 family)